MSTRASGKRLRFVVGLELGIGPSGRLLQLSFKNLDLLLLGLISRVVPGLIQGLLEGELLLSSELQGERHQDQQGHRELSVKSGMG